MNELYNFSAISEFKAELRNEDILTYVSLRIVFPKSSSHIFSKRYQVYRESLKDIYGLWNTPLL